MKIINIPKNTILIENCPVADSFFKRFIGLLGKKSISSNEGLIIKPCNSIHMFFMKFSLDVIFVNKKNEVVAIYENIKPWKFTPVIKGAYIAIELSPNTVVNTKTTIGDVLGFE